MLGSFIIGAGAGALVIWWIMKRRCGNPTIPQLARDTIQEAVLDPFSSFVDPMAGNYPASYATRAAIKMY